MLVLLAGVLTTSMATFKIAPAWEVHQPENHISCLHVIMFLCNSAFKNLFC